MSNRIEIVNGDEGWRLASRLLEAVWPPEVVATLPWKDVVWARPDSRVLKMNGHNDVIGHAGIYLRHAEFDARPVKIGGVGGVATRFDLRGRGIAGEVMREAVREMRDNHGVDFGLLFCEPRHAPLYKRLGWRFFEGEVFVSSLRKDACVSALLTPSSLTSKLRRVREYSTCADCRGEKSAPRTWHNAMISVAYVPYYCPEAAKSIRRLVLDAISRTRWSFCLRR